MTKKTMGQFPDAQGPFIHPLLCAQGVRERLVHYSLTANKGLGQNFLINEAARDAMLFGIGALPVYEIGPGMGALTMGLLQNGRTVFAIEKDACMVRVLEDTLACSRLTIRHGDALELPLEEVYNAFQRSPFYVAGNLPYYITSPLCLALLSSRLPIRGMALMLQQEAAERFFAAPNSRVYGPLRVLAACAYNTIERVATLSPADYYPQPKVHSTIIRLTGGANPLPEGFPAFLSGVFAMRRKTICNNLLQMAYTKEAVLDTLRTLSQPEDIRACAMEPEALLCLYRALTPISDN